MGGSFHGELVEMEDTTDLSPVGGCRIGSSPIFPTKIKMNRGVSVFKTSIASTPFTSEAANSYFQNITGDYYGGDCSFLSTLRALVAPRIKEGESVYLTFGSSNYNSNAINSVPAERAVGAICSRYRMDDSGVLMVHSFNADQSGNLTCMQIIEKNFTSVYPEYHRLDKVKAFYRKSFNVDCYINPDKKSVIVFVDNLDIKKMHYLQVSILAFMPWYLNQDDGLTEDELALMQSLRETNSANYEKYISKLGEGYDFRTARIRQLLGDFETRYERIECDSVRNEIVSIDEEIQRLNDAIGAYLSRRNDKCIKLMGLEQRIAEGGGDSEIMEYFLCNNRLVLSRVSNTDMYFSVKDYLEYFDREMAERSINNRNSYIYRPDGGAGHNAAASEKMQKLMREIFVSENPRLRIRFCAAYRFDLNGSVSPQTGDFSDYTFDGYMPNTHIDRFHCMGNYLRTINELLRQRNYIGALEQCIASCKSLNFGDSAVMGEFMKTMWSNGSVSRCIELPDGRVVKPNEAIRWLEEQEAQNGQAEEAQNEQTN